MNNYVTIKNIQFPAVFSITPEEQEKGLMGVAWPPPVMCFLFKDSEIRKFWMKNTISPLDIIFCHKNKIIDICYGHPLSEDHVGPDSECDLVIELPYGHVDKLNIKIGDDVKLHHSLHSLSKFF